MATGLILTSGSILAGNPITFEVTPSSQPSSVFHRLIIEVKCERSGKTDGTYEIIKLTSPITNEGQVVSFDVSSALRVPLDDYEYTPYPTTYPYVSWNVRVYEEYMDKDGQLHSHVGETLYPGKDQEENELYLRCIAGAFSDIVRMKSGKTLGVKNLSTKPASPQIVAMGEKIAYTPPFADIQTLENSGALAPVISEETYVDYTGMNVLYGMRFYVLPAEERKKRQVFRFINSFGVLESISVPRVYSKKLSVQSEPYAISLQETFNTFSRSAVKKRNNRETWLFQSDPLDEEWLYWYLHEFLMSEHVWLYLPSIEGGDGGGSWLPVTIIPEEETTFYDRTKSDHLRVSFTAQLDINGSPYM